MTKPFRIGLIMYSDRLWIGGTEYAKNIIFALASLPKDIQNTFEISLLTNKSEDHDFIESVKRYLKKVYFIEDEIVPRTLLNRIKWRIIGQLFKIPNYRFDTFFKKNNFDFVYPYFSSQKGPAFKKSAAWIPDFQHKYLPQYFTAKEIRERDMAFGLIAKNASTVVLSSKCAAADFKTFYPEAALKAEVLSFRSIPQARWSECNPMDTQKKYCLPDKFFIISNQFWQHKNHLTVFSALKLLKDRALKPVIVCTGHIYDYRQPEYSDTILRTIHQFGLSQQVYLLGLIPRLDQIQLLRRSIAIIQPSLFEGWSTAIEEAKGMGKPAILSDFPVHLEQAPSLGRYFDRTSPESLAQVMADWWQKLSPGPDMEQEAAARKKNIEEVRIFAYKFLEIAEAVSKRNKGNI
jgi:glycosyltransferase involved in cell wall biosynthesis